MYDVRKLNGKLVIVNLNGNTIYSMPSWVRVNNRDDLRWLADRFNEAGTDDITAIMEFETKHSTVRKGNARE